MLLQSIMHFLLQIVTLQYIDGTDNYVPLHFRINLSHLRRAVYLMPLKVLTTWGRCLVCKWVSPTRTLLLYPVPTPWFVPSIPNISSPFWVNAMLSFLNLLIWNVFFYFSRESATRKGLVLRAVGLKIISYSITLTSSELTVFLISSSFSISCILNIRVCLITSPLT